MNTNNNSNIAVGTVFTYNNSKYIVTEVHKKNVCEGCDLEDVCSTSTIKQKEIQNICACVPHCRVDRKNVVFKKVIESESESKSKSKDFVEIEIPENKEIDVKNSDFEHGIITFKNKAVNLEFIINNTNKAKIVDRYSKIFDLAAIAGYYNNGWKPTETDLGFSIGFNMAKHQYVILNNNVSKRVRLVAFKNREICEMLLQDKEVIKILNYLHNVLPYGEDK